jgi:hypothetical protein
MFVDAFLRGDAEGMRAMRFRSPAAEYDNPAVIAQLFRRIVEIVEEPILISHLVGEGEEVAFFAAQVGAADIDGVWRIAGDEVTLMVRPLDALLEAVKLMRQ